MAYAMASERLFQKEGERDSSRIHERLCVRCRRWFWAWDAMRHQCFVCEPLPAWELRAVLDRIDQGAL